MAYPQYLLRFRAMTTDQLTARQAALWAQETIFTQQQMGGKSMTRDLTRLEDQLEAIAFVLRERGSLTIIKPTVNLGIGCTDFGGIQR
jgi:hypothetical protein